MPPPPMYPEGMGPPDGGYGWVVAAAYALNNIINIPIMQNFGLVFRGLFADLGIDATDTAVIVNMNNAFGLALGLFNGPILRRFSYRSVAAVGAILVFLGMVLTSFAQTFIEFFVFYGIIMSAGFNLSMASFGFAINSYFSKRRGLAMGYAMTATGLGPIFMPHVVSLMMYHYGPRNTSLLLAALSLHSLAAALLLQPVRKHLVKLEPEKDYEAEAKEKEMTELHPKLEAVDEDPELRNGDVNAKENCRLQHRVEEDDGDGDASKAPMLGRRRTSSVSHRSGLVALSRATSREGKLENSVWTSMGSIDREALGGSILALNEDQLTAKPVNGKDASGQTKDVEEDGGKPWWRRWLRAVVVFFDLDLLRDPIYVNILLGMSLAVFAEINFSLLTPFILGDRHFTTQEIASLVSTIAVADIIFRFLAPFIKKMFKQSVRVMYMSGLFLLISTRTVLIFCYSFESLMGVMLALGVAKGLRTVYWVLVVPDHVPIERLPAASGLQSLTNGIVFLALGPIIGLIRDRLGDYNYVIMAVNVLSALTIVMWTVEFVFVALKRKRRSRHEADVEKSPKT